MPPANGISGESSQTDTIYQAIFEGSPVAMILVGEDTMIRIVNTRFSQISGYKKEAIEGKRKLTDIITFRDPEIMTSPLDISQICRQTDAPVGEVSILAPSGDIISNLYLSASPLIEKTGYVISFSDISSIMRTEAAFAERELQYSNAMDLAHLVNWEFDVESGIFHFDDRFYSLYGTSAAREGGNLMRAEDYVRNFVYPDDIPYVADVVDRSMQGFITEYTELEHRIVRRDGTVRTIVVRLKGLMDENGKVVKFYGANQDITKQKENERKLRESEERYRYIFESMQDLYYQIDSNGIITTLSPSLTRLTGWTREELINKPVALVYDSPGDRVILLQEIQKKGYVTDYEITLRRRDGTPVFTSISAHPMYDENGSPTGIAGIIRDISDRKQAEKALKLANKKLTLLSSITRHDINNSLSALHAYLYLSYDEITNPSLLREYITKEQMITNSIIQQIAFTGVYENMGIKAPVWQNVHEIIHQITNVLGIPTIVDNTINPLLEIFADSMLEKVFYNLIDNALHYAGEHMTTIRVGEYQTKDSLIIQVMDDGGGIDPDAKSQIFEKGFGRNTGLGLFLTREILAITDITIHEVGIAGKGACFEITIPRGEFRFSS